MASYWTKKNDIEDEDTHTVNPWAEMAGHGNMKFPDPHTFHPLTLDSVPTVRVADAEVHAGFPSPVDDAYMSQPIDLNKELVKNPAASFIVRVMGDSMIEENIEEGDLIVVDRSLDSSPDRISVCMYNGEFCLKRIVKENGKLLLMSGNPSKYAPIEVHNPDELQVWGVVRWVMKKK